MRTVAVARVGMAPSVVGSATSPRPRRVTEGRPSRTHECEVWFTSVTVRARVPAPIPRSTTVGLSVAARHGALGTTTAVVEVVEVLRGRSWRPEPETAMPTPAPMAASATIDAPRNQRRLRRCRASLKRTSGAVGPCPSVAGRSKVGDRTVTSADRLDHRDEVALSIARAACRADELSYLGEKGALFGVPATVMPCPRRNSRRPSSRSR